MEFIDLKSQQKRVRQELEERIKEVLDHGRYIMGPEIEELEIALSDYVGVRHALGVSSGTDSLLIALMALGVGSGDQVITVPYTWISTAEVVALVGAETVFVDVEPQGWNMCPDQLERAITDRTKAIMPVGIFGQTANMTAINDIAANSGNIPVIEDAAQSFGATHHGKRSCSLSTIGSTSFFPSKPLGGYGDGGAVFTDDEELATKMKAIRNHGQTEAHQHPFLGLNGRLDSIQAAVIATKMKIFEDEIEKRNAVAENYSRLLEGMDLELPQLSPGNTSVYAQYTILSERREEIRKALSNDGIPSVSYYSVPLHLQPVFCDLGYREGDFPVTEQISSRGLSLPMSPYVDPADQERIAAIIRTVV